MLWQNNVLDIMWTELCRRLAMGMALSWLAVWCCGCGPTATVPKLAPPVKPTRTDVPPAVVETWTPLEAPECDDDPSHVPAYTLPPFDTKAATERVVLFTAGGPLIVDLEITIDGHPYRLARQALIEQMLAAADTNKDGEITWTEALSNPRFALGVLPNFRSMSEAQQREQIRQFDLNRNGTVEQNEVELFASRSGDAGQPFSFDNTNPGGYSRRSRGWETLDRDADGLLSGSELHELEARLAVLDADDDELLRAAEFDGPVAEMSMQQRGFTSDEPPPGVHAGANLNWGTVNYWLEERYLYEGELAPGSFPLDPSLFEQLDANGSGLLDRREIERLGKIDPHLVLEIAFGESTERPAGLRVKRAAPVLGEVSSLLTPLPDGFLLTLGGTTLRFSRSDALAQVDYGAQVKAQLAQFDEDKNGYLEKKELEDANPMLSEQFELVDSDGDGKLYPAELEEIARLQQAPQQTRVQAAARSQAGAIFDVLDANHDRVLSRRELREGSQRILACDKDGDSQIAPDEVPGSLSLALSRGAGGDPLGVVNTMAAPQAGNGADGPRWFIAMDANGDGDVSRREFLGTTEQFSALDTNNDGLLNADEARAGESQR